MVKRFCPRPVYLYPRAVKSLRFDNTALFPPETGQDDTLNCQVCYHERLEFHGDVTLSAISKAAELLWQTGKDPLSAMTVLTEKALQLF